jgi:hypothetical protein
MENLNGILIPRVQGEIFCGEGKIIQVKVGEEDFISLNPLKSENGEVTYHWQCLEEFLKSAGIKIEYMNLGGRKIPQAETEYYKLIGAGFFRLNSSNFIVYGSSKDYYLGINSDSLKSLVSVCFLEESTYMGKS